MKAKMCAGLAFKDHAVRFRTNRLKINTETVYSERSELLTQQRVLPGRWHPPAHSASQHSPAPSPKHRPRHSAWHVRFVTATTSTCWL